MKYKYTWDQAIEILRNDPAHSQMIFDAYLSRDIEASCKRFEKSDEFKEVLKIIKDDKIKDVLDVPAGNGIASFAFALNGYNVTAVEPDDSSSLGRSAIQEISSKNNLHISIVNAWGENLPFNDCSFDLVYVRQGLHHAADLNKMVSEFYRVLRPGGILLATREHVVDNHKDSLKKFLDNQVDHQLYGGENAFLLSEYKQAIKLAGFKLISTYEPYSSVINLHPNNKESLRSKILSSTVGKILSPILSHEIVYKIGLMSLKLSRRPGRLYSFKAIK
ncbi:MAG: methylase involved in ubiquinone/menaquinone biosynthesis [Mucilaginibacter sp.]|jgi:ubiquinone/menaquinone biosynthesis C-methylase UbiE|nr:methylase involved in ubiquinone/menaquinone biosynthesis [Mucilaginibacter sp.]